MAHEEPTYGETEPTLSEEVESHTDEAPAEPPVLNRAERRAQARGAKKGSTAFNPALPHNQNTRGPGNRGPAGGGQVRFPRTGHK